jgi:hypothetical protein
MTASATATTVRVFGVLAAFTGVEHGLGEISQGPGAPPATVFESWPHVAALDPLGGEPAMSLIPDLLISGVLSVLVAVVLGTVALRRPGRPHSGPALLGVSLALLLVGGGFGPPLLGVLTGLLATRIDAPTARGPGGATRLAARAWPWPLVVAVGCFLGLVPGTALLYAAFGTNSSTLVSLLTLGAFTATALAMWTARARDHVATAGESARPSRAGRDHTGDAA